MEKKRKEEKKEWNIRIMKTKEERERKKMTFFIPEESCNFIILFYIIT